VAFAKAHRDQDDSKLRAIKILVRDVAAPEPPKRFRKCAAAGDGSPLPSEENTMTD
jgi:hypothetical protein